MSKTLALLAFCLALACARPVMAQDQRLLAITVDGYRVIGCWDGNQPVAPLDCVGRDVISATSATAGLRGVVARKTLAQVRAEVPESGDKIVYAAEVYAPPIPLQKFVRSLQEEVDLNEGFAVFQATDTKPVALAFEPPRTEAGFDKENALRQVQAVLVEAYDDHELGEVLWVDVDGDQRVDAVTIAFDRSGDRLCEDLIVVILDDHGNISNRASQITRLTEAKCPSPSFLEAVEQHHLTLLPWPMVSNGFAVQVLGCIGGCDGSVGYLMPLEGLATKPAVAAAYDAFWWYN